MATDSKKQKVVLRYLRMPPRKVRLVADSLRGMHVNEAEGALLYERRRAAKPLLKLLRSAVANANVKQLNPDQLFVESIQVDQGPMLKRFLPRARGMATPIQKKMSHITMVLGETTKQPRFKIVVPKKVKTPAGETKRKRPVKEAEQQMEKKLDDIDMGDLDYEDYESEFDY